MAVLRFDQNHRFDTGLHYDANTPSPPLARTHKRIMNIIKLALKDKTIDQKIPLGQNHITSMTGNTNYPVATRQPTDAQFQTIQDDLVAANNAVAAAETAWKAAIQARNDAEIAWDAAVTARAGNCEAVTPGDRAALQTTGFPLRANPSPVGLVGAPLNLRSEMGKLSGTIELTWDRVHGANSYIIECKEHDTPQPWSQIKILSQSRFTATALTPGKTYAFHVRALGSEGEGPWSDETVKMAP